MDLLLSGIFGLAQLGVGGAFVWRLIARRAWGQRNAIIGALAGIWLLISGGGECLVAWAEATRQSGAAHLRGGVDAVLLVTTVLLFIALAVYLLVQRATRPGAVR
jgi:hypothetical protein